MCVLICDTCVHTLVCIGAPEHIVKSGDCPHYINAKTFTNIQLLKTEVSIIAKQLINNVRNTGSPTVIAAVSKESGKKLQELLAILIV